MYEYECACHSVHTDVKGQLAGVSPLTVWIPRVKLRLLDIVDIVANVFIPWDILSAPKLIFYSKFSLYLYSLHDTTGKTCKAKIWFLSFYQSMFLT